MCSISFFQLDRDPKKCLKRFDLCKVCGKCVRVNKFMSLKYANLIVKKSPVLFLLFVVCKKNHLTKFVMTIVNAIKFVFQKSSGCKLVAFVKKETKLYCQLCCWADFFFVTFHRSIEIGVISTALRNSRLR